MGYSIQLLHCIQIIYIPFSDSLNQLPDFCQAGRWPRGGDTIDAQRPIFDTPLLDQTAQGMVGDGFFVYVKGLASDGARGVTIIEPLFDAGTVECLSRANGNGIKHKLK